MSRDGADPKTDSKTSRLFDKRTVERSIKKGAVARKDYEKYLKSLDDVADKGVYGGLDGEASDDAPEGGASGSDA